MTGKPSVDDLRARLRDLGYLDAGVDRFVLGPVRGTRGPMSVAWRSSARIGLLAGLLLGPSTALALGARLPGLVTGLRDALVLALYLGGFFAAGATALAFLAALLLGTSASRLGDRAGLAKRARRLSQAAAVAVAGACLVYLVSLWRVVGATGPAWYASAWTWAVLAGAVAISLLLGYAARLTTLGAIAQAGGARDLLHRPPARSWLSRLGLGAAVFAVAAGLLAILTLAETRSHRLPAHAARIAATPTGAHLTVIAVDGLDVPFLERLVQAGRLPATRGLLAGARAVLPASDEADPARTWTSIATGQPAEVHGISGISARRVSGLTGTVNTGSSGPGALVAAATDLIRLTTPALSTSLQRRSRTFWEVAADAGIPTVVVNWWATWPVPEGSGVILSDRATLRLDVGGALDAEIAPPSLYGHLRAVWPEWRAEARRRVVASFGGDDPAAATLRRAADQDSAAVVLATRVVPESRGLRAAYLPGLDIAQHDLVGTAASGLPPSVMAARIEALERYYQFLDSLVASLAADLRPDDLVVVVADPGRSPSRGDGLLAISGGAARAGLRVRAARDDVMPTLLYALGLPVSRDLPGRPRTEMFTGEFVARVPLREVASFGSTTVAPRTPGSTPLDEQMLDRLRSLGYVR